MRELFLLDGLSAEPRLWAGMMCEACSERRKKLVDALLAAKIAEAAKQAAIGAAELVGLKDKGDGKL